MGHAEDRQRLFESIQTHSGSLVALGNWLWRNPETGFREHKTMARLLEELDKLGLNATTWQDTTGFYADIHTGKPGPCVGLLAELDSVICHDHPDCDKDTGAVHACGHHIQTTALAGTARALLDSGVLPHLCGTIRLIAVPAEECLQIDWRMEEIRAGRLHFLGGKAELLSRGAFDGVDVVVSVHAAENATKMIGLMGTNNGFVSKSVSFKGTSAHAASPYDGKNALYMANTALTALNGLRETFRDSDAVRVHPILASGGTIVNAIPEKAHIECLCRASNMDAVLDAAAKFDRAMGAGAYAFAGSVTIETLPGYMPGSVYRPLWSAAEEVALDCLDGPEQIVHGESGHETGSSDLGDLQSVLPAIQCYTGFTQGHLHAADWRVASDEAYLLPTQFLSLFTLKLLENEGAPAREIRAGYRPRFASAEAYCAFCSGLFQTKTLP